MVIKKYNYKEQLKIMLGDVSIKKINFSISFIKLANLINV